MKQVLCKVCEFDYAHIIGTMNVKDNDRYQATEVIVNNEYSISTNARHEYRSQGNVHILFGCEEGHFFIKSFDGHKGNMFEDENPLMDGLAEYLNDKYKDEEYLTLTLDFELLGNIENYFKSAE